MASGTMKKNVNPPNVYAEVRKQALVNGTITPVTSEGGWYQVRAINANEEGGCYAYLMRDSDADYYISADQIVGTGTYVRCTTQWVYFPKGTTFYARKNSTYDGISGLFYAPEL